jgi:hypothetical protein
MRRLTWAGVLAWRMRRGHLAERAPRAAMLDVVARIAGLHAQVMSCAELTLWARVADLEPDAVRRALWEERTLVETWAMRGTLHLLPAAELPLWVAAQSVLPARAGRASWLKAFGLTPEGAEALAAAIPRALDGEPLTREELATEVERLTGSADLGDKLRGSWGAVLKPAALAGDLCFAPSTGSSVRFTSPARWLGPWRPDARGPAAAEVTRRYLAAYGPATREEFARWFGSTSPALCERMIQALGDTVGEVDVEGVQAWMLASDVDEAAAAEPAGVVRLLPGFDHYVVAAPRNRDAVLPEDRRARVYRPQGWISPVLVADGRMLGVWRHERRGRRLDVAVEPFGRPAAAVRRGAEAEAERLAAHLGGELSLSWG